VNDNDLAEVIDTQIQAQGVACFKVSDGQVFIFTIDTLERLLAGAKSHPSQVAKVFVKSGASA
jgi:hypothetical protein